MSPFGLFDLLQTLLPTPNQTPEAPSTPAQNINTETPLDAPHAPNDSPQAQPPKPNACADFLCRHEARARDIRSTKKRSE